MSDHKQVVVNRVNEVSNVLLALSHKIHANPETAWQEFESSAAVAKTLSDHGFDVVEQVAGLPTAFRAEFGTGDLTVALCAEYDALPGLGHACGHNIIASSSAGAAIALAAVANELNLKVVVLGTPAEEGGGGKIVMLERGAFDGIDVAALVHPGPVDVAFAEPFAVRHVAVKFSGKAAHAAAYPEQGINAADAFTIAQVAIGLLRQQLPSTVRVHGVMTRGGEAPNAIPEVTEGRWYIRATSTKLMEETFLRIVKCFEAGALATGCELEIHDESKPYSEFTNHPKLNELYKSNAEAIGRVFDDNDPRNKMNRASTDLGNVSKVIASIHPYIGVNSGDAVNHQKEFAASCITSDADQAVLDAAKAMAMTLVDIACDPALREYVKGYSRP
ncbi:MAG: M20 family metallopeptidase [Candidatus Nanopelagicales bacterium]|nr:M20 family metallopeptidase [Candidatus Nanopelagicales bacterium]